MGTTSDVKVKVGEITYIVLGKDEEDVENVFSTSKL